VCNGEKNLKIIIHRYQGRELESISSDLHYGILELLLSGFKPCWYALMAAS